MHDNTTQPTVKDSPFRPALAVARLAVALTANLPMWKRENRDAKWRLEELKAKDAQWVREQQAKP